MKSSNTSRVKGQVYSIGNYLMTGKVLGKGHFARVEEATHRVIGKKVAIKIIDLTLIKEEYARRNLHREPRVMARLRHPCIAALYETMMHGPRLYVVMEAAGGGDLCAHVLAARGAARGLAEAQARGLAAQLVSAVRHMHSRGVVHRDLKMENIMLDSTKQFIKIVDFGLSNVWSSGGWLRTPCGSLEYAAPELFVDGRRYGPEVDLWSIGVIVYGMVTGGLPFTAADGSERSRPQLRAAIARGFTRKQRAALAAVSTECKTFIQHLLEPKVELRMKIEEAARHRWVRRPGLRLRTHPLAAPDPARDKEIYKQISEISSQPVADVVAQVRADPFGALGGMYNIKTHLLQLQAAGGDLLWSALAQEPRPPSPPEYPAVTSAPPPDAPQRLSPAPKPLSNGVKSLARMFSQRNTADSVTQTCSQVKTSVKPKPPGQTPHYSLPGRPPGAYAPSKTAFKTIQESGDCFDSRLPCIDEHSNTDFNEASKYRSARVSKAPPRSSCVRKVSLEEPLRLSSCPAKNGDAKRLDFYRRAGDGLPSWRASGPVANPARILLQSNATTIKRASLGNIVSPHSSTNSHCKSERAMPVGWYSGRPPASKDAPHLQRFRRSTPLK